MGFPDFWQPQFEAGDAAWPAASAWCVATAVGNIIAALDGNWTANNNIDSYNTSAGVYDIASGPMPQRLYLGGAIHTSDALNIGHHIGTVQGSGTNVGGAGWTSRLEAATAAVGHPMAAAYHDSVVSFDDIAALPLPALVHFDSGCRTYSETAASDGVPRIVTIQSGDTHAAELGGSTLGHTVAVFNVTGHAGSPVLHVAFGTKSPPTQRSNRIGTYITAASAPCIAGATTLAPALPARCPSTLSRPRNAALWWTVVVGGAAVLLSYAAIAAGERPPDASAQLWQFWSSPPRRVLFAAVSTVTAAAFLLQTVNIVWRSQATDTYLAGTAVFFAGAVGWGAGATRVAVPLAALSVAVATTAVGSVVMLVAAYNLPCDNGYHVVPPTVTAWIVAAHHVVVDGAWAVAATVGTTHSMRQMRSTLL